MLNQIFKQTHKKQQILAVGVVVPDRNSLRSMWYLFLQLSGWNRYPPAFDPRQGGHRQPLYHLRRVRQALPAWGTSF